MRLKLIAALTAIVAVFMFMCSFTSDKNQTVSNEYSARVVGRNVMDNDRIIKIDTPKGSYLVFVSGNGGVLKLN